MQKIYVTGIAGTGKTTIYNELKEKGFTAISLDETPDLCCWINKITKEKVPQVVELNRNFTSKHQWVCDVDYLEQLINIDTDTIFVLGIASNQADFLDLFDKVLLLQCKPEIFLERLTSRTSNDFGKDENVKNHLLTWYEDFENKLLKNGAIAINTDKPINEVVDEVVKQAKS